MIEEEIFKRRTIDTDNLEKFGFVRKIDGYCLDVPLVEGMRVEVVVDHSARVRGKVYDEELKEEYMQFRLEGAEGKFVNTIRTAYIAFLQELADRISTARHYAGAQACRISEAIEKIYHVSPEFLWDKFPHYGVYRHPESGKWFGIIMDIDKSKVDPAKEGASEVMNLKTDEKTPYCIEKGAYPSYHMNHKSWISLILDDSLPDAVIFEMIAYSYENVSKKGRKKGANARSR